MNRDLKKRIAYEVLIILGVLVLLCYITRLWPLLFLVIPFILITALRLLFMLVKKAKGPAPVIPLPVPPRPDTEQDVVRVAFGILQRRITEQVTSRYPAARWVWGVPDVIERFAGDLPLTIVLNRAGGFSKAAVQVHNLQFCGLLYETAIPDIPEETPPESDDDMERMDYSALAFEWADANLLALNTCCNEALAGGETALLIPAHELPHPDSWPDICAELMRNGFTGADVQEDGIMVTLPK